MMVETVGSSVVGMNVAYYYKVSGVISTKKNDDDCIKLPILIGQDHPYCYYAQNGTIYKIHLTDWREFDSALAEMLLSGVSLDEAIKVLLL